MSKSKKKFYTRISIVVLVLGLGIFALVQSFRGGSSGKPAPQNGRQRSASPEKPGKKKDVANNGHELPPAPDDTIVRANNDDSPGAAPDLGGQSDPSQPPAQFGGTFSPQAVARADYQDPPIRGAGVRQVDHEEPTPAQPNTETPIGSGLRPDLGSQNSGLQPADAPPSNNYPTGEPTPADPPGSFAGAGAGDSPEYDAPSAQPPLQPTAPGGGFQGGAYPSPAASSPPVASDLGQYAPAGVGNPPASLPPAESPDSSYAATAAAAQPQGSMQGATGGGSPGPQELEGAQSPSLSILKTAPPEIQVNKPATFNIRVQNTGRVEAHDVTVRDQVPVGVRLIDSTPAPSRDADGSLVWNLGSIQPGEESTIVLRVLPLSEGEIGSTASVTFAAHATVRTFCTKPLLAVKQAAPRQVLIGQEAAVTIEISNPGTGVATGVVLEEDVPEQFVHPAGRELEHTIGLLKPNETRELELRLKADRPGIARNLILVRGEGNLIAQHEVEIEVVAPELAVEMAGPRLRYLERQATYTVSVSNPGTAPAKNVELVAHLPRGLKFVSTNNAGQYDTQRHAVFWSLEQLPAKESGSVQLTTLPIEMGEQKIRVEGAADLNLEHASEEVVMVEGLAELFFQVRDEADPIELGSDTVYAVQVTNQGSVPATNVIVSAILPPELQPLGGEGPSRVRVEGQRVVFEPLARLTPKSDAVYRIQVKGRTAGDHRIKVQVASDQTRTPVTKEESTRVYSDR